MKRQEIIEYIEKIDDFDYQTDMLLIKEKEEILDTLKKKKKDELVEGFLKIYSAYLFNHSLSKSLIKEVEAYNKVLDKDGIDEEVKRLMFENKNLKDRLSKVIEEKDRLDDEVSELRERLG